MAFVPIMGLSPEVASATDVKAGVDLWVTPNGASYDVNPIPAGFFTCSSGSTSLAYTAGICLQGVPLATTPTNVIFPTDTIVERKADALFPGVVCPESATVPIEIVALQLQSCAPITVTCADGTSDQWNVDVCLDPIQPQGSMTIRHECRNGGTYDASLPVLPQFTFTRVVPNDGAVQVFVPTNPIIFNSSGAWSHGDLAGLLHKLPAGSLVDSDCDGIPDNNTFSSTLLPEGFFPGLRSLDCTCSNPTGGSFQKPGLTPEQQLLAAHGVFVSNAEKAQVVGACCDDLFGCVMTSQFTCNGFYVGDGIQCTPDPCTGTNPPCGDGVCDTAQGETPCTCPLDCGAPPPENCTNGIDDDCDQLIDCNDPDCATDPACTCPLANSFCQSLTADCVGGGAVGESCWPVSVSGTAVGISVDACACATDVNCGPINITTDPFTGQITLLSCIGTCPDPNIACQIHVNGNAIGQTSINPSQVQAGQTITCGCPTVCTTDADCADTDPCTQDTCNPTAPGADPNGCLHTPIAGCCTTDAQCDDNDPCTIDACDAAALQCVHTPIDLCCTTDAQCNDNDPCTIDACDTTTNTCTHNVDVNCPGACCLPDGKCTLLPPTGCLTSNGQFNGPGSNCLGDGNGNGIDDACEASKCQECAPGIHWIDNPGCPPGGSGSDTIPTGALVGIDITGDCVADTSVVLSGVTTIAKLGPLDDSNNFPGTRPVDTHKDVIDTEIVQMNLSGGGVSMTAGQGLGVLPLNATLGTVAESTADPSLAQSRFDVLVEVQGAGLSGPAYNQTPITVLEDITCMPPNGRYIHFSGCTPLYDSPNPTAGQVPIGNLVRAIHFTFPDCCLPNGTCQPLPKLQCEAAGGTPANCLGDSNGDGLDDACVPPTQRCPEPAGQDWCLNVPGCIPNDPTQVEFCLPSQVTFDAAQGPVATACACFIEGPGCGPVTITPIFGTTLFQFSCKGICADGTDKCLVHVNGVSSGSNVIDSAGIAAGDIVTCECPPAPVPEACCLPDGTCQNLLVSDCLAAKGKPLGPTASCLGDGNGNGIDDACESNKCQECGPGAHWIDAPPCPAPDPNVPGICKSNGANCFSDADCPGICASTGTGPCSADADCPGRCSISGTTCNTDADCGLAGGSCVGVCNISGAPCASDADCPGAGDSCRPKVCTGNLCNKISADQDTIPTGAVLGIDLNFDCVADTSVVLSGAATIHKLGPFDDSNQFPGLRPIDQHKDVIDTEILSMNLTRGGVTMIGGQGLGTIPLPATLGAVAELPIDPTQADSFFDVFVELTGGGLPGPAYNQTPIRVKETVNCLPPNGRYIHFSGCTPLYDSPNPTPNQVPIANLVRAIHFTFPDCCLPNGTCQPLPKLECEAAGGTPANCLGDSNGDGFDDACVPPPQRCPEPAGQDWCANDPGCVPNDPTQVEFCLPTHVIFDAAQGPVAEACQCFIEGPGCGPVTISPIFGTTLFQLSCKGVCPDGTDKCLVHVNGVSSGSNVIDSAGVAAGDVVTCECPSQQCEPTPDGSACKQVPCPQAACFGECINGSYCDDPNCCIDPNACQCYAPNSKESIELCGDCFGECVNGAYCDPFGPGTNPDCCIDPGMCACYTQNSDVSLQLCKDNVCFGECVNGAYCDPSGPNADPSCCIVPGACACYDVNSAISKKLCQRNIPTPPPVCQPKCVTFDPVTGVSKITACDCVGDNECHAVIPVPGGGGACSGNADAADARTAAVPGAPCVLPNTGGTVQLPPAGCPYLSPDDAHKIIDGLPPGTEIIVGAEHSRFQLTNSAPGGTLGGEFEQFTSTLTLNLCGNAAGTLAGFSRTLSIPVTAETHVGPRTAGAAVQDFDTDMFQLQGELLNDPDFDLIRITGGTNFGLPSPGHTTLTQLPGGDFNVDSFFDITYQIEFVGAAGSMLDGMSGQTTAKIHMQSGATPSCEGLCGPGERCFRTQTVNADGTIDVCCNCCPAVDPPKPEPVVIPKNRYLSFIPNNPGRQTALRVTLVSAPDAPGSVGSQWWVGPPVVYCENSGQTTPDANGQCGVSPGLTDRFKSSKLQCNRHCMDWGSLGEVIHIGDINIVPNAVYEIQAVACDCDTDPSVPLVVRTVPVWGDVDNGCQSPPCECDPPNGVVGITLDVTDILNKFSNLECALSKVRANLDPADPSRKINISDVTDDLDAFASKPYPFPKPVGCPAGK